MEHGCCGARIVNQNGSEASKLKCQHSIKPRGPMGFLEWKHMKTKTEEIPGFFAKFSDLRTRTSWGGAMVTQQFFNHGLSRVVMEAFPQCIYVYDYMIVYDRICTFAFFCFFSQGFWLSIRFPWTCKPRTQSNLQKVHFVSWPCFMMFSDMEASKHRGWHYPVPACCLGWSCASVRMAPVTEGSASTVYHIQIIQKIMRRQGNQRQKKVKKKCEPSLLDAGRFAPSQLLVLPCTSLCCFSRLDKGCECISLPNLLKELPAWRRWANDAFWEFTYFTSV